MHDIFQAFIDWCYSWCNELQTFYHLPTPDPSRTRKFEGLVIVFEHWNLSTGGVSKTLMSSKILELLNFHLWIKSTSFNVWVRYVVGNFKSALWNSTQNILPIHWKIWFLYNIEILRALRFKSSYAFLKSPLMYSEDPTSCEFNSLLKAYSIHFYTGVYCVSHVIEICLKGPNEYNSTFVQIMAWCLANDKRSAIAWRVLSNVYNTTLRHEGVKTRVQCAVWNIFNYCIFSCLIKYWFNL